MDDLTVKSDSELVQLREVLVSQLDGVADFTPGAFQEEWGRCGKPNCHCHDGGDRGHGPRYSVMRYEGGRPVKRAVPSRLAGVVKARVDRWGVFKSLVDAISSVNTEVSRRLLLSGKCDVAGSVSTGQKGG